MSNRPTEDFDYQMASSNAAHTSVFANANGVRIEGNFTANINTPSKSSLEVLYQRVSPNAILNIGGRGEDARCHPGTREEVIGLMERWMDGAGNNRIFWMSGPAGGGKTAIMKTVTERAAKRGVPTANFFFFRGDSSRNSAHPVVATLLYQLFRLYPSCLDIAAKLFAESPRILDESMEEQCKLISALFPIIPQSLPAGAPIFILIDGLDECDVEADRSQRDILHAFERLVMKDHSPFRLLVASRQEPRIQMIFNQLPSTACSIFLGKKYSPQNDIRIFVQAEFDTLKVSHPSKGSLPSAWPSSSDVDAIIAKSSGQFIYAATVMRYISHPSIVPTLGLERVMGFVPVVNNSPFANLDSIYTFILGRVSDADAMRDILSMKMVPRSLNLSDMQLLSWYNSRYNSALIESCVSELSAIIKLDEDGYVQFYHASLDDFLRDQARSGPYWIDVDAFRAKVLVMVWRRYTLDNTVHAHSDSLITILASIQEPTADITHMFLHAPLPDSVRADLEGTIIFSAIKRLYYPNDIKTYKCILRRVIFKIMSNYPHWDPNLKDIPYGEMYYSFYQRWSWGFRLLKHMRSLVE